MLFLKSTVAPVAPGVYTVDVAAKPPGKTYEVYAALDVAAPPEAFVAAIEAIGFRQVLSKPYTHNDGTRITDVHFRKPGTDIFEGWTNAEKEANLAAIEQVLARFGIAVTPRVMSLAEAFR